MAAAFKDFIPMGNDNDSNSGDSWFVLSSASEEEDDESEEKIPKILQLENCQKEITEKRDNEPKEQNLKVVELNSCHKETTVKMDEECEDEKSKVVELENCQKESNDEKDDPINEKLKMTKLENCQETAGEKNDPTNEKLKMAKLENCQETAGEKEIEHIGKEQKIIQLENYQKETAGEKENEPINKKPKMEPLENYQKEIPEKKENEPINKKPKMEPLENYQKEIAEKKENEPINKKPKMEQFGNYQKEIAEKKEREILEKNLKLVQLEIHQKEKTKEKTINETAFPIEQEREIVQENERPDMTKHKRKSKGLSIDEGSHSEIALEVHALRETLIQLSLNLSNTEQEKHTAITSEVQSLRETVSQLNNDISSRISQIETRTEQVHTLLCRFIMARYGNNKEPIGTAKERRPNTSDVAVQAEMADTKQTLKIESSTSFCTQNTLLNENREILPTANMSPHNGKVDNIKPMGKEVKGLSIKTDFSSKVQPDSHGLKRPRSDGESNQASSYSNETFEESTSYSLSVPSRRDETSKFSKEKSHYNRHKLRHNKSPSENYHSFRGKFHQYPPTHQTQTYGSNRELAELAYRYSSENDRHWRKNTSNRAWQSGNHRKHPYFKKPQEGDICSSDAEVGKPVNEFPDVLDDFMDKVIDEWAQDEDD